MRRMLLLTVTLCFQLIIVAQQGNEPVNVTDLLNIKSIANVALNNDGTRAAFTVTAIEPEADKQWEYKYVTQLWLVKTDGASAPRQLTFSKEGALQPAWSPDGKQLAFIRTVEGKPQIFLLLLEGGEPLQLTRFKYGAVGPRWSADGKQLLFTASIALRELLTDSLLNPGSALPPWPFEKPGFAKNENLVIDSTKANPDGSLAEIRSYLNINEKDNKARVINKLNFQEEATTSAEIRFTHIFITDAKPGAGVRPVTCGFYSFANPQFIAGTTQVLVEGEVSDTTHPDRNRGNGLFTVNTDGSGMKQLLGRDNYTYGNASISPNGKWIALQHGPPNFVSIPSLAIMPAGGTEKDLIHIPLDRTKTNLVWNGNNGFYFSALQNGGVVLYRYDIKTKTLQKLTDVNTGIGSYAVHNNNLIYVKTAVTNPFELYMADAQAKNEKRISAFNQGWLQQKKLSLPEKCLFVNEKGMTVEYWVMKPINYEPGKKYPTLLEIHGGPAAMWGPGESSMWHEYQYFCSKGYVVVYSNPRGSGGYGEAFLRGNINDWGNGPMRDVLTSLDKAGAAGFIDTSKLMVTGGSYAGYLVAWIIAHDKRFKAACSQRGVYDLHTFFGEGNAWRLLPDYFGGYPWQEAARRVIERESPINYVANITTPYIIFHGENDLRTGVIQSEMLYKSLKVLNRPVEYVRHPGATHEITRSGNNRQRIDQMLRTWEFFERWLKKP